jgi:hypothetical protein
VHPHENFLIEFFWCYPLRLLPTSCLLSMDCESS